MEMGVPKIPPLSKVAGISSLGSDAALSPMNISQWCHHHHYLSVACPCPQASGHRSQALTSPNPMAPPRKKGGTDGTGHADPCLKRETFLDVCL